VLKAREHYSFRGGAADLLLMLTRRDGPDGRVQVDGDEGLFAHWLGHSRF
jgi:hypothetical protein